MYAIAIHNLFDCKNTLFILLATDEVDAAKKALIEVCPENYRDDAYKTWVAGLGETWEEVWSGAINSEYVISNPIKLS